MSGNSFGKLFVVTGFGESHGPAIGGIVDGCPPGLALTEADLQRDLDRRKPGQSRHTTQRRESDQVEILSGVFEGRTTGAPIGLLIRNEDQRSKDYAEIADRYRPGHADLHLRPEIRPARLSRRRTLLGPRDRDAGRGRGHRQEIPGASAAGSGCAAISPSSAPSGPGASTGIRWSAIPSSGPVPRPCRIWRPTWTPCARRVIPSARR